MTSTLQRFAVASLAGLVVISAAEVAAQPAIDADPDHPPYAADLFHIPRAGHGGFQRFLFDDADPERSQARFSERCREQSDAMRADGTTPMFSIMHWRSAYADTRPGSGKAEADSPAHRAWHDWMRQREDHFWISADGQHPGQDKAPAEADLATAFGWIAPPRPLDPDDPDRDASLGVLNYGQWFNQRLADYAARTGVNGVGLADHFDQLPHDDVSVIDFNPAIIQDFARYAGLRLPDASPDRLATLILDRHFPAWIDYWNHAYADWYGDMARRLGEATGVPAVIKMQKHTYIHDKRYHGIDARLILDAMPDDATLAYQVEAWSVPWDRGVGGDTLWAYVGMVGTHLCREPGMLRGIMMPMAGEPTPPADGKSRAMSVWRTTSIFAQHASLSLTPDQHEVFGNAVLDAAWLALPWVHVATRDGRVERAAGYVQRQYRDVFPRKLWENIAREITPTRPFGPALYYAASIESQYERQKRRYHPVAEFDDALAGQLTPAYYVSDVAIDRLTPEHAPSAWLVADLERLPRDERVRLQAHAPVFDLRQIDRAPVPFRFSANASGLSFLDQEDRITLLVAHHRMDTSRDDRVEVSVHLDQDGIYRVTDLRSDEKLIEFEVRQNRGTFGFPLRRWETRAFSIVPVPDP